MTLKTKILEDIKICKMERKHLEQVVEIEKQFFSEAWTVQNYINEISKPSSYLVVACIGENVIGHVGMYTVFSEGYILNIAVREGYHNLGIGKMLMEEMLAYSLENELEFITLEVRKSNINAINFYKKLEFDITGERKDFYKYPTEDAYIMTGYLKTKE